MSHEPETETAREIAIAKKARRTCLLELAEWLHSEHISAKRLTGASPRIHQGLAMAYRIAASHVQDMMEE